MAKVTGCWVHKSLVWDELKTVKFDKSDIVDVWLDIANAHGSVAHQLLCPQTVWSQPALDKNHSVNDMEDFAI